MVVRLLSHVLAVLLLLSLPALAEDAPAQWTATKLRGTVQQMVDQQWSPVALGDVIPNERQVRTLSDGHAEFQRGAETVGLGTNTRIAINDDPDKHFTTVQQDFGSLEVEANVERAPHFEVDTPFLAAVVKGTHFIVTASDRGGSVTVTRGLVAVKSTATRQHTDVAVGQIASIQLGSGITVKGDGKLPEIITDPDPADPPAPAAPSSALPGTTGDAAPAPAPATRLDAPAAPANGKTVLVAANGGPAATDATIAEQPVDPIQPQSPLIGLLIGIVIGALGLVIWRYIV